tara:strand:+ start:1602 stop:2147 length:546 start_codon:yes stop_codon:yes gene_type:complete
MKIEDIINDSEILYSCDEIKASISNIADTINEYFKDAKDKVTVLPVMKGAIPFAGYLIPQLSFNTNIEYIHVTRYHQNKGTKDCNWIYKPNNSAVKNKDILVLDDILDEGVTLLNINNKLKSMGARSIVTAILFNKKINKNKSTSANFIGLEVPNKFVYGFGLDFKGDGRNLPNLYSFNEK